MVWWAIVLIWFPAKVWLGDKKITQDKNTNEICKFLGAASCNLLSIDGLYKALIKEKRNNNYPQFSDHYFTGDYPIKALDELGSEKITQLSLLSNKSSS